MTRLGILELLCDKLGIRHRQAIRVLAHCLHQQMMIENIVTAIDPISSEKVVDTSLYPSPGEMHLICPHGAGAKNYLDN